MGGAGSKRHQARLFSASSELFVLTLSIASPRTAFRPLPVMRNCAQVQLAEKDGPAAVEKQWEALLKVVERTDT